MFSPDGTLISASAAPHCRDVTKTYERMQMTKKSDRSRLELDSFGHTPFVIHGMFSKESQAPETSPGSAKVLPKYELGGVHSKNVRFEQAGGGVKAESANTARRG